MTKPDAGNFPGLISDLCNMMETVLPEPPEVCPPPPARDRRTAVLAFFRRLHFYVGVFVGPFLLVSALTGVLYTVAPSMTQALHRHELSVEAAAAGTLPLSQQVRSAQQTYPGRVVLSVATGADARATTRVVMSGSGCPCTVFVDPHTARVRGEAPGDGGQVFEAKWSDDLHRTLFLGEFGRNYAELSASWLWVLVVSGPVLWFFGRRTRGGGPKAPRLSLRGSHATLGLALSLGLLFLSASGLSWSLHAGENIDALRTAVSGANPPLAKKLDPPVAPAAQGQPEWLARVDRVHAGARSAGLVDPIVITATDKPDSAWTASDRERHYPMRNDRASVNPQTGAVVAVSRFQDWPMLAKITQWAIALHMGLLFGWANQLVLAVLGIGLAVMIVLGYRMWWARRPRHDGGAWPAPAPQRGALGELPPSAAAALTGALLFAGWFLPLFGASLAGFVLIDALLGWRARRRAREAQ
ncbi:PepSY-associated TM helix domain-containing protein [Segniliparus rotundus]|uniref:PepSY-associated TM helix domain-containing protein n=1 Tax=Segniliparus rotundus TaxID=286802 RepID=UPI0003126B50|nr:PepSY domain-containing protein [Segniliparus rotundus]